MVGLTPGRIVFHGKQALLQRIHAYNRAARFVPWLCLVDQNGAIRCPPRFVIDHMPDPSRLMLFRIAVRTIESWLLADRTRCASFLHVSADLVPHDPERLANPKLAMVNLARRSGDRHIVADMAPRDGSGASVGPAYASRLQEFAAAGRGRWG